MLTDKQIGFAMRKAEEKGADACDLRMLLKILQNMDDDFCAKSNEQFMKIMNASERSVSNWIASLKEKDIIGVIQNKHAHRRQIYIRGINKEVKFAFEPALEDMSEAQRKFKCAFPDRKVDCEVPDDVDIDLIIAEINNSKQIQNDLKFMTLFSFCHKYYKQLLEGTWRDKKPGSNFSTGRHYTKEECNSLFQNVEEIEL